MPHALGRGADPDPGDRVVGDGGGDPGDRAPVLGSLPGGSAAAALADGQRAGMPTGVRRKRSLVDEVLRDVCRHGVDGEGRRGRAGAGAVAAATVARAAAQLEDRR